MDLYLVHQVEKLTNTRNTSMTTNFTYFNIDKTVNVEAETTGVKNVKVVTLWTEGGHRNISDLLGLSRAINVTSAIEFMMADEKVLSVKTECGVTVHRGKVC